MNNLKSYKSYHSINEKKGITMSYIRMKVDNLLGPRASLNMKQELVNFLISLYKKYDDVKIIGD